MEAESGVSSQCYKCRFGGGTKSRLWGEPVVRGPGETARVTEETQSGRWEYGIGSQVMKTFDRED